MKKYLVKTQKNKIDKMVLKFADKFEVSPEIIGHEISNETADGIELLLWINPTEEAEINLEVSEDNLEAYITVSGSNSSRYPEVKEIIEFLESKSVVRGLQEKEIAQAVKKQKYYQKILVAKGQIPIHGRHGYINYLTKQKPGEQRIQPKELEDGSIDYKNLQIIENIQESQVLAEMVRPREGKAGFNVYGKDLPPKIGKEVKFYVGKNVKLSEEGDKIYSTINGMLYIENKKISVMPVYNVKEVGLATGNIDFKGTVIVDKDVESGYIVKAEGDIVIGGSVEKSDLISGGSVIITGNYMGKKSGKIEAKGDVTFNFAEDAEIFADGNVYALEGIFYSNVNTKRKVIATSKHGTIIGGRIEACEGVEAKIIGSKRAFKTIIEVGFNPEIVERVKEENKEKEELMKEYDQVKKNISYLNSLRKKLGDIFDESKKDILLKSMFEFYRVVDNVKFLEKDIEVNQLNINATNTATVDVGDTCFSDVVIKIQNSSYTVRDPFQNVRFFNNRDKIEFTSVK